MTIDSNKILAYINMIFAPLSIVTLIYIFMYKPNVETTEPVILRDTVNVIEYRKINTDSILAVIVDKADLYNEPSFNSSRKAYLTKNSIFYIIRKSEQKNIGLVNGKKVEDYWYEINITSGFSGWVFGAYTSKTETPQIIK